MKKLGLIAGLLLALLPVTLSASEPPLFKFYAVPGGFNQTAYPNNLSILCDTEKHVEYIIYEPSANYGGRVAITPRINGNYCV